jgi:hypothetical protein
VNAVPGERSLDLAPVSKIDRHSRDGPHRLPV